MVRPSDRASLQAAWRALATPDGSEGWRTISVASTSRCLVHAGRRLPANEEAILFRFDMARRPTQAQLPSGRGFAVSIADVPGSPNGVWVAVTRQAQADLDLFLAMGLDLLVLVQQSQQAGEVLFDEVHARIRAWQDFMRKGAAPLSPEEEVGLYGELEAIRRLCLSGLSGRRVIDGWEGPLAGLHDFKLGDASLEVKSSLSPEGFIIDVSSLEQLDGVMTQNLHLLAVQLVVASDGQTLPEKLDEVSAQVLAIDAERVAFWTKLLQSGYRAADAARYTRRFSCVATQVLRVRPDFPSLRRSDTSPAVVKAVYQLDLDAVEQPRLSLDGFVGGMQGAS
jgi:Putative  PD-(D/E)XK family member, (DUF4420)